MRLLPRRGRADSDQTGARSPTKLDRGENFGIPERSSGIPPRRGGSPPHLPLLTDGPAHAESTLLSLHIQVCARWPPRHAAQPAAPVPLGLGPGFDLSSRRWSSSASCVDHALVMTLLRARTSGFSWLCSAFTFWSMPVERLSSGVSLTTWLGVGVGLGLGSGSGSGSGLELGLGKG